VRGIKKQNLVEVKSLPSPPPAVKLAIESVCTLLGEKDLDWKAMRSAIMRENFISSIVGFNTEDIR
jgi:dynein heavy chain 1, cytosolic